MDRVVLVFDPNCPSMKTVHKYVALSRLHQKHYDIVKRQVAAQAHSSDILVTITKTIN